jgi:hypothetical protein
MFKTALKNPVLFLVGTLLFSLSFQSQALAETDPLISAERAETFIKCRDLQQRAYLAQKSRVTPTGIRSLQKKLKCDENDKFVADYLDQEDEINKVFDQIRIGPANRDLSLARTIAGKRPLHRQHSLLMCYVLADLRPSVMSPLEPDVPRTFAIYRKAVTALEVVYNCLNIGFASHLRQVDLDVQAELDAFSENRFCQDAGKH